MIPGRSGEVLIEFRGITKRFPGVLANDNVNLQILKGEVHGLLGENGAGKTTLMNVLYGLYRPESGEILVAGKPVHIGSPGDAIRLGIAMVHQHFMLVATLTVLENVILGLKSRFGFVLDLAATERKVRELANTYGLHVDPRAKISQLSVGEQQRVEILKAIYRGAQALILDEPTGVLTPQEAEELFAFLRGMKASGGTIIFITHKLKEALAVSDRVTVMRRGRVVNTLLARDSTLETLAQMMIGRRVLSQLKRPGTIPGMVVLSVQDAYAVNDKGRPALKGVNLEVREGEIVGLAGVAGSGQNELVEVIYGLRHPQRGRVFIGGTDVTKRPTKQILTYGVGYIPEDRMETGLILDFTVAENMILQTFASKNFSKTWLLDDEAIRKYAEQLVREFDVRAPGVKVPSKFLSGGNLQRLILAREISRGPKVLLAFNPTRGLDVGATEYVRQRLLEEKERGAAVLLISEELEELRNLSDRIVVIFDGRIVGAVDPLMTDESELGLMMTGARTQLPASHT